MTTVYGAFALLVMFNALGSLGHAAYPELQDL
jgi:hypothetical protein